MEYTLQMGDDGILRARFVGDVDQEGWYDYANAYQAYLEAAPPGQPLHFLVDASRLGKMSAAARKLVLASFRNPDPRVGRTAMLSASPYARVLVGFILKATGRDDIRFFASEEEALAWLRGESA